MPAPKNLRLKADFDEWFPQGLFLVGEIQAVISGSMDIAAAAGVSAAVGTFAKGAPIRIIGSEMIGAPDLYWYVPSNSPIRKIEDFNGKTVAFSLTGSSSHAGLLALIAQYKLTAKPTMGERSVEGDPFG